MQHYEMKDGTVSESIRGNKYLTAMKHRFVIT